MGRWSSDTGRHVSCIRYFDYSILEVLKQHFNVYDAVLNWFASYQWL